MTPDDWLEIVLRITPDSPADLDADMFDDLGPGVGVADDAGCAPGPLSARLWDRDDPEPASVGVRVTRPLADCADIALRLASIAVERDIYPVILTSLPVSGFEPFGFRVERIAAAPGPERTRQEEELSRFWALALIVDAEDIALVG